MTGILRITVKVLTNGAIYLLVLFIRMYT